MDESKYRTLLHSLESFQDPKRDPTGLVYRGGGNGSGPLDHVGDRNVSTRDGFLDLSLPPSPKRTFLSTTQKSSTIYDPSFTLFYN